MNGSEVLVLANAAQMRDAFKPFWGISVGNKLASGAAEDALLDGGVDEQSREAIVAEFKKRVETRPRELTNRVGDEGTLKIQGKGLYGSGGWHRYLNDTLLA
jgi:hypothetical protein